MEKDVHIYRWVVHLLKMIFIDCVFGLELRVINSDFKWTHTCLQEQKKISGIENAKL